jgi:hypothetical protein
MPIINRAGLAQWASRPFQTSRKICSTNFPTSFPLTTQMSSWYAGISLAGILFMAAMALYGFYTSLGGRPVFGGAVLEE